LNVFFLLEKVAVLFELIEKKGISNENPKLKNIELVLSVYLNE
jgi:hypothetical protein